MHDDLRTRAINLIAALCGDGIDGGHSHHAKRGQIGIYKKLQPSPCFDTRAKATANSFAASFGRCV